MSVFPSPRSDFQISRGHRPFDEAPRGSSVELLLLAVSLFWAATAGFPFIRAGLAGREAASPGTWGYALALFVLLAGIHLLLLGLVATRRTVKPLLAVLLLGTAFAVYFTQHYGVVLDPTMLRNALKTDTAEARELFTPSMLPWLAGLFIVPALALWRWPLAPARRFGPAVKRRLLWLAATLAVLLVTLLASFQSLSSDMRNHKAWRYAMLPVASWWSAGVALAGDARTRATGPLKPVGADARWVPTGSTAQRPQWLVLVVGETVRDANWQLSGYARPTTPRLAALAAGPSTGGSIVHFPAVQACGTNTEVSLPCMFAPIGRRDYDEDRIRSEEGLLHVLARAGYAVQWRDNQSGCKGVCEGLPQDTVLQLNPPGLCADGRCLDEGLLAGLADRLAADAQGEAGKAPARRVLVLHTLGNHGPSYFRRYPPAHAVFSPACTKDDLRSCERDAIVNAYDNAIHYTDAWLGDLIGLLQAQAGVDSAVIYVSDHGESLGENGLYLHGLPHALAPREQREVPMTWWLSPGFAENRGLDLACLRARAAAQPAAAHDHLFHTVAGLLDVQTQSRSAEWDLQAACRRAPPAATR